jgi:hypothetical protein
MDEEREAGMGEERPRQEQYKDERGGCAARLEARLSSPMEQFRLRPGVVYAVKLMSALWDGVKEVAGR